VTVWPHNGLQWLAILALGLGPVGGAFFTWDIGVKHGDIQVLGALAYAAPLLSTVILVLTGWTAPSWSLAIACLLIVCGGLFAARDLLRAEHR
jgi:drug/metabolite transporter (DMT)-like permease